MKLILSRKGFDAQYGGVPSPIFPDGRIVSLPIPAAAETVEFADLNMGELSIGILVDQLSDGRVRPSDTLHLDPDLNSDLTDRNEGWVPAFGQSGQAQGHLRNEGVGSGDLFLYYGWFREVDRLNGSWRYKRGSPDLHVLFGWLRVEEIIRVGADTKSAAERHPHLNYHPHLNGDRWSEQNTVYVGRDAGAFERVSDSRILTMPGRTRSYWRLPGSFNPDTRKALSYHRNSERWQIQQDGTVCLHTVAKGQEFVLDLDEYPDVYDWIDTVLH